MVDLGKDLVGTRQRRASNNDHGRFWRPLLIHIQTMLATIILRTRSRKCGIMMTLVRIGMAMTSIANGIAMSPIGIGVVITLMGIGSASPRN